MLAAGLQVVSPRQELRGSSKEEEVLPMRRSYTRTPELPRGRGFRQASRRSVGYWLAGTVIFTGWMCVAFAAPVPIWWTAGAFILGGIWTAWVSHGYRS